MRTKNVIQIISCHAEGEVGNVIVGGVRPPPGDTLWQQSRWIDNDKTLRNLVLNEPRGGVFKHINLLVPARDTRAEFGFIIMEPEHTPPIQPVPWTRARVPNAPASRNVKRKTARFFGSATRLSARIHNVPAPRVIRRAKIPRALACLFHFLWHGEL